MPTNHNPKNKYNMQKLTTVFRNHFFKNLDIILFENCQRINQMSLSSPWAEYKNKQLFTNMKM